MQIHKGLQVLTFINQNECLNWLAKNHNQQEAVWFKFAKKKTNISSISYEEAREAAIMYGWIDGLKNSFGENFYVLRFTARRPNSNWSKINCAIAEKLIKSGRMKTHGHKEVDAARKGGRWYKKD